MATTDSLKIMPDALAQNWRGEMLPLAFVDLALFRAGDAVNLPPFPVIGIGDPALPFANRLDGVVEAPFSVERLMANVIRFPTAAAALVALLRSIDGLPAERALPLESFCYGMLQGSTEHAAWLATRMPESGSAPSGRVMITRDEDTLTVVIDRPEKRNAIDRTVRDGLFEAFSLAAIDQDIARVSLRSTGSTFSIGADLTEFGTTRDPATAHRIRCLTLPAHPLSRRADIVDVHVQGACIGAALEMTAFASRVTAAPSAWFQLPELAMGLIPGAGGCVSVSRRIGRQRAALMILSGKRINAASALRWGLIDAIVDELPVDPGRAHGH